jgi:serine/threonine protein phosphatase 1
MILDETLVESADRLIAIGDIHGQYDLLLSLLSTIKFDSQKDILIFVGDYIDRGKTIDDEKRVVEYLIRLRRDNPERVFLLKGNHEDMAELAILNKENPELEYDYWWRRNGAKEWEELDHQWLLEFCQSLPLYIETEDYFFVHAGALKDFHPVDQDLNMLLWERNINQKGCLGKQLVVGHTPRESVTVGNEVINVDTGAFYKGRLSAFDLKNTRVYEVMG